MSRFGAVIVAAGNSSRMAAQKSKVLLQIGGETVIAKTVRAFENCANIAEIVVVCRREDIRDIEAELSFVSKKLIFVFGGGSRQESVLAGAQKLSGECNYIIIHDGARPFVRRSLIERLCAAAEEHGAATAGVPAKDTVKTADGNGRVIMTHERKGLFNIQTPQAFEKELYFASAKIAVHEKKDYTDDCGMVEAAGYDVYIIPGDDENIKLTTPQDMIFAQAKESESMRIGSGYDVHRLEEGRRLVLGGVEIPYEKGLLGHSDADVLCHAVIDSLLGAAAMGDIGKLFPDSDPQYKDADSLELLRVTAEKLADYGFAVKNTDATVIAQKPKLAPYIEKMRDNIAKALKIKKSCVSVKATTEEGLGFSGRGEGIAASAVSLILQN